MLYTTLEVVRIAALLVQPVMPESAAKLLDLLGQPADQRDVRRDRDAAGAGHALPKPEGVFPATRWSDLHHSSCVTPCHTSAVGGVLRS